MSQNSQWCLIEDQSGFILAQEESKETILAIQSNEKYKGIRTDIGFGYDDGYGIFAQRKEDILKPTPGELMDVPEDLFSFEPSNQNTNDQNNSQQPKKEQSKFKF